MQPWHDFHITGYAVNGKRREMVFELEWPHGTGADPQRAKLGFSGVECYYLEHDLGSNIVYSFAERPLQEFLTEWTDRFEAECQWGWPPFWRPVRHPHRPVEVEKEEAFRALTAKQVRCIELSSSYGLSGWILAVDSHHEASHGN
ncbi:hypothetical protein HNP48_002697 [Acidovorax soli]|uniref:Uncharacterized protein n=1 Tax=Acidovorax soli TaxID=592050 RepID=A0A7X0U9Y9_9BURK|nr:hypothetical protein [Acidovorax soli]MBB6560025.1 hypothetical protein [Acidovorax soli]